MRVRRCREQLRKELDRLAELETERMWRERAWLSLAAHLRKHAWRKICELTSDARDRHSLVSVVAPVDPEENSKLTDPQVNTPE